jgi:hypothetical protein
MVLTGESRLAQIVAVVLLTVLSAACIGDRGTEVACECDCHADPVCDGTLDTLDLLAVNDVVCRNADAIDDPNPSCPYSTTDVNCDGTTDVLDLVRVVDVVYRGEDPTDNFCVPCP